MGSLPLQVWNRCQTPFCRRPALRWVGRGLDSLLGYYCKDPLHMNAEGYRLLGRVLWNYLLDVDARAGSLPCL